MIVTPRPSVGYLPDVFHPGVERTSLRRALLPVAVAGLLLAGCGDGDETGVAADAGPAATEPLSDETVVILAIDNSFEPEEETVPAGATVVWENRGRNDHDIVPEDPDAPWAVGEEDFMPGDTAEYRFTEPGTYRYYCSIHGTIDVGMPGVLIVE
jgi:plastocyanin